ncbi:hypothetical protein C882_1089 [Caenispirillum salinarum AK4]|uniref:Uncharacterized protein n=1 Tax=Caenispirillum salinarum AK4 TaxID=1238182 RepID=K9HC19_9PROT|nr:hypothetical protein C882_1089 [Caenispirillum salinarum AK4]
MWPVEWIPPGPPTVGPGPAGTVLRALCGAFASSSGRGSESEGA